MRLPVVLGVLGIAMLAGIPIVGQYMQPAPRDEESLCLVPARGQLSAEPAHHVLVLDKTDPWNAEQGGRLRTLVIRMRDQLDVNERLSIFVFDGAVQAGVAPVFSLCNPGRGSDTTILWSNPRRWETRFQDQFGTPLNAILDDLAQANEGPVSPILELLIDLTNREELNLPSGLKRIVLVSDMLQNSDAYSMFNRQQPVLSPERIGEIVELRGGLRHLHKFRVEVYQVRGVYSEERLIAARQFWNEVAGAYGVEIEWKVL